MSQILKLIFGIVLYLLEFALNLNAFFQYMSSSTARGSWVHHAFWGIVIILFLATVLVNVVAIANRGGHIPWYCYGIAFVLQLCAVLRYFEEFSLLEREKSRKLLRVRFTQALFNSGPQCVLHLYIMVDTWNFSPYAIASLAVSFISLVWGFYSFSPSHRDLSNFGTGVLLIGKLGFIISRLVLLTFFIYSFAYYSPFVLLLFSLIAYVCIQFLVVYLLSCYLCVEFCDCCKNANKWGCTLWNCLITLLTSMFDVTSCFYRYSWIAVLHFLENFVMFCVEMWADPVRSDNIDTLRLLTLTVVLGGFGVGWVFCGLAYRCFIDHGERDLPSLCYIFPRTDVPSGKPCSLDLPKHASPNTSTAYVVEKIDGQH